MKIPAQEKIAELERRIAELEAQCEAHFGVAFDRETARPARPAKLGQHWSQKRMRAGLSRSCSRNQNV